MGWIWVGVVVLAAVWARLSWRSYRSATDAAGRRSATLMAVVGAAFLALAAVQLLLER